MYGQQLFAKMITWICLLHHICKFHEVSKMKMNQTAYPFLNYPSFTTRNFSFSLLCVLSQTVISCYHPGKGKSLTCYPLYRAAIKRNCGP